MSDKERNNNETLSAGEGFEAAGNEPFEMKTPIFGYTEGINSGVAWSRPGKNTTIPSFLKNHYGKGGYAHQIDKVKDFLDAGGVETFNAVDINKRTELMSVMDLFVYGYSRYLPPVKGIDSENSSKAFYDAEQVAALQKYFLEKFTPNPHVRDAIGRTELMTLMHCGTRMIQTTEAKISFLKEYLEHGGVVSPDATDHEGKTELMYLLDVNNQREGALELLKFYCENGGMANSSAIFNKNGLQESTEAKFVIIELGIKGLEFYAERMGGILSPDHKGNETLFLKTTEDLVRYQTLLQKQLQFDSDKKFGLTG